MARFEKAKKSIRLGDDARLTVQLPFPLAVELMGAPRKRKKSMEGIVYRSGNLTLYNPKLTDMFTNVLEKILDGVKEVMDNTPQLEHIFLVGGFSNCILLREALERYCASLPMCRLVIPNDAELAIIKGAVYYGHYSAQVVSRIARKTYGYIASDKFDESRHSPQRRYVDEDGQVLCGEVFRCFLSKNENISTDSKRFVSLRLSSEQTQAVIPIFQSDFLPSDTVQYRNDPKLQLLGKVRLETPIPESMTKEEAATRQIVLTFFFGTTEILCEVHDVTSGNSVKTVMDFF